MRLFSAVTAAVALLSTVVLAAPSVELKPILKFNGPTHPNSYIVKLKSDVVKDNHLAWLDFNHKSTSNVTYRNWQSRVFHGYAGEQCRVAKALYISDSFSTTVRVTSHRYIRHRRPRRPSR